MNQSELDRMEHLNRYLDDVSRGMSPAAGASDLEFAQSFQRLQQLDRTPGPTSAFAENLRQQLASQADASVQVSRRRIPRHWIRRVDIASAAALAAAMLVIVIVYSTNEPQGQASNRVAITNEPTPTILGSVGSNPTPTGQAVAVVSPEPSPTSTSPAQETEETVIQPPVQASDFPIYASLEQIVNAADVVVVGQPTGNVTQEESGQRQSEFLVDQTLRGRVDGETILLNESTDLVPGDSYVLFLSHSAWSDSAPYSTIWTSAVTRLNDGRIVPWESSGSEYHVAREYADRPLEELAQDIAAIPEIEPRIERLIVEYDWTPIGKGLLRVVEIPAIESFSDSKPLRYSDASWEMALEASRRVGLDFSQFAGQQLQILPYYLERRPADGERNVQAMLLISEQQIVGAWVVVSLEAQPFGLDQREQALGIPVAVPTLEPTSTWPVPSGETVNPAELYDLADASHLILCWPYCDETAQSDEVREQIVDALSTELVVEDISTYPTPTPDYSLEQASGDFVNILFWEDTPFQGLSTAFGYDRQTGRILLPFDGGWVAAPPELATIFDEVEVPPPPSKTKP